MRTITGILCGLLLVLGWGCTPSTDDGGGGGSNNGNNITPDLVSCQDNTACRGGEVCREGFCREACSAEDACQGELTVCDPARGYCVGCLQDSDCAGGQSCDAAQGFCVSLGCTDDAQCAGGQRCDAGRCLDIEPEGCEPGSVRCSGAALLFCDAQGAVSDRRPCASGESCVEDAQGARCSGQVCEPNAIGCQDAATAWLCNAEGTAQTPLPCRADQFCQAGACRQRLCDPNEVTCDGDTRLICNSDGTGQEVAPCAQSCDAPAGCYCEAGACQERACVPGTARCVGNSAQACDERGRSYQAPQGCGAGVCVSGRCLEAECEPGQRQCAGSTLLTCNDTGTGYREEPCGANQACVGQGAQARCDDQVCQPNTARCQPGQDVVLRCDALGSGEQSAPCAQGQFCREGVCLTQLCDPSEGDLCIEGDVFACDARGQGYALVQMCGREQICTGGACEDRLCSPLSVSCQGSTLVRCAADGLSEQRVDCAAQGQACDEQAGACVTSGACNPAPDCGGDTPVLNEDICRCVECLRNSDCPNGLACVQRRCLEDQGFCDDANDCPDGAPLCVDERCVDCVENADCTNDADGPVCHDGVCGPCDCTSPEICNSRGICFDPNNCASDDECVYNGIRGRCDPDSRVCYTPGLCGQDLTGLDPFGAGCPSGLTCAPVFNGLVNSCVGCQSHEDCRPGEQCLPDLGGSGQNVCSGLSL